jgi:glycerol-3-phosphate dehydrogenase
MAVSLKRDVSAMTDMRFDLCIIGGGVTGLFVAHDAAARGLSVALLERGDFAEGTSSASTKLIHGGTRYLEHYEFGLVREALRERGILLRLAPHLTNPIPFMIPIYRGGPVPAYLIRMGMLAYDVLSYDKNWDTLEDKRFGWHHYISPARALDLEPELKPEGLRGASVYYDGQAPNPMRLCLEVGKTAAGNGARLANYAEVKGLRIENGRVTGVEALDRLSGNSFVVRAKLTINCAGIWAEEVMRQLGTAPPVELRPSKGIHLVTRPISHDHAVVSVSPTGRRVMVIPWRGKSLIGTTDDFYEGDKNRIRPTREEAQALLDEINDFIPSARLTLADIEAGYAGARPLVHQPGKSASDLSREYKLIDHGESSKLPGLLSIVGGKLTTSRSLAQTVVNRALKLLGERKRPCLTDKLPIGGGDIGVVGEYLARQREAADGLVDDEVLGELVRSYGSGCPEVLEYVKREPRLGKRIADDRPFILAQIHHAVEHEMATSVSDVALRRTDAGNLGDRTGEIGRVIAEELQALRGFDDAEKNRQLERYLDEIAIDGLERSEPSTDAAQKPA